MIASYSERRENMFNEKRKRKIVSVVLVSLLLLAVPTMSMASVLDEPEYDIMPCLTYIVDTKTSLTISGGEALVDCWVTGDVLDATKTKVIAELQLKSGNSWIAYGTWTNTQNAFKASVYQTKAVTPGHTYRVKATHTVWEGSQSEQIVVFTDEVTA